MDPVTYSQAETTPLLILGIVILLALGLAPLVFHWWTNRKRRR